MRGAEIAGIKPPRCAVPDGLSNKLQWEFCLLQLSVLVR